MNEPKFLLIVKVRDGLWVRNTPRPESLGGVGIRKVAVGRPLYATSIHVIDGVPYARLVPQRQGQEEWVRVREADSSTEYVDVIELESKEDVSIAQAILELAKAVREGNK